MHTITRQKNILSLFLVFTLLWQNIVWAGPFDTHLAPNSGFASRKVQVNRRRFVGLGILFSLGIGSGLFLSACKALCGAAPKDNLARMAQWISRNSNPSTRLPASHPNDPMHSNWGLLYDHSVAAILLALAGDKKGAYRILDFYHKRYSVPLDVLSRRKDRNNVAGIMRILPDLNGRPLKGIINGVDIANNSRGGSGTEWYVDSGSQAWLGIALLQVDPERYLGFSKEIGDFILRLQDTDGAVIAGPKGQKTNEREPERSQLKHTEHNISSYAFLMMLYEITRDSRYRTAADRIKGWLLNTAYSEEKGYFLQGFHYGRPNGRFASDAQTWAILALGVENLGRTRAERILRTVEEKAVVQAEGIRGMDFTDPREVIDERGGYRPMISPEWTAGLIMAYHEMAGNYNSRAERLYGDMLKLADREGDMISFPYATLKGVSTGHGWNTPSGTHSLAGMWMGFAEKRFNPFRLGGKNAHLPIEREGGVYTEKGEMLLPPTPVLEIDSSILQGFGLADTDGLLKAVKKVIRFYQLHGEADVRGYWLQIRSGLKRPLSIEGRTIIADIDLLRAPAEFLLPFLIHLAGHEGSHSLLNHRYLEKDEEEAIVLFMDALRFSRAGYEVQDAIIGAFRSLKGLKDTKYIEFLERIKRDPNQDIAQLIREVSLADIKIFKNGEPSAEVSGIDEIFGSFNYPEVRWSMVITRREYYGQIRLRKKVVLFDEKGHLITNEDRNGIIFQYGAGLNRVFWNNLFLKPRHTGQGLEAELYKKIEEVALLNAYGRGYNEVIIERGSGGPEVRINIEGQGDERRLSHIRMKQQNLEPGKEALNDVLDSIYLHAAGINDYLKKAKAAIRLEEFKDWLSKLYLLVDIDGLDTDLAGRIIKLREKGCITGIIWTGTGIAEEDDIREALGEFEPDPFRITDLIIPGKADYVRDSLSEAGIPMDQFIIIRTGKNYTKIRLFLTEEELESLRPYLPADVLAGFIHGKRGYSLELDPLGEDPGRYIEGFSKGQEELAKHDDGNDPNMYMRGRPIRDVYALASLRYRLFYDFDLSLHDYDLILQDIETLIRFDLKGEPIANSINRTNLALLRLELRRKSSRQRLILFTTKPNINIAGALAKLGLDIDVIKREEYEHLVKGPRVAPALLRYVNADSYTHKVVLTIEENYYLWQGLLDIVRLVDNRRYPVDETLRQELKRIGLEYMIQFDTKFGHYLNLSKEIPLLQHINNEELMHRILEDEA